VTKIEYLLNIKVGAPKDHIHLVISIPPKFAVSEILGFLKANALSRFAIGTWNSRNGIGVDAFGQKGTL